MAKGMDLIDSLGAKETKTTQPAVDLTAGAKEAQLEKDLTAQGDAGVKPSNEDVLAAAAGSGTDADASGTDVKASDSTTKTSDGSQYAAYSREELEAQLAKTRSEAAKRRVELKDMEQQFQTRLDEELGKLNEKLSPITDKAQAYDKLKAEEADKKRDLNEKVAHREQLLLEKDQEIAAIREQMSQETNKLKAELGEREVKLEAHDSFYKERLQAEIDDIPQKFAGIVDKIVKGAGDVREALEAIRESKRENLFGTKKVVVNHSVPGAHDGARTDSVKVQQAQKDNMKSSEKIKQGLKNLVTDVKTQRSKFGI
jgi:chromosome segregation ATPase